VISLQTAVCAKHNNTSFPQNVSLFASYEAVHIDAFTRK